MTDTTDSTGDADLRPRRPTEADYPTIVERVDEWWGGRRMRALLPRLWFQHFTGTSWILETDAGRPAGFIVAFISPDDPTTGYVHMIAADPNHRRAGIGKRLYGLVFEDLSARGVGRVHSITWPGNRTSVAFHRASCCAMPAACTTSGSLSGSSWPSLRRIAGWRS